MNDSISNNPLAYPQLIGTPVSVRGYVWRRFRAWIGFALPALGRRPGIAPAVVVASMALIWVGFGLAIIMVAFGSDGLIRLGGIELPSIPGGMPLLLWSTLPLLGIEAIGLCWLERRGLL